jgi:hypothetical protein
MERIRSMEERADRPPDYALKHRIEIIVCADEERIIVKDEIVYASLCYILHLGKNLLRGFSPVALEKVRGAIRAIEKAASRGHYSVTIHLTPSGKVE